MKFGIDRIARGLGAALVLSTVAVTACSDREAEPATGTQDVATEAAPLDPEAQADRNREILQRRIESGPVVGPAASTRSQMVEAAVEEFHTAQQAILGTDLVVGIDHLEQAVALDPGFGEAWFQLGEARHLLALIRVSNDADAEGLKLERAAVDALREARRLLDGASVRTLDAFELDAMRKETAERLAELDPVPTDDREALARLRDLAHEMASELPVLDEEGDEGSDGGGDGSSADEPGPVAAAEV